MEERSRAHFAPWMPARTQSDRRQFHDEMARAQRGLEQETEVRLVAVHREDRDIVAVLSLSQIFRGSFCSCYAGWRVSASRIQQGFGTEAVGALVNLALTPQGLGLHRVQANIIPRNIASTRLARKVGFRCEGVAERYLQIAGVWEDHAMFAITSEELSA